MSNLKFYVLKYIDVLDAWVKFNTIHSPSYEEAVEYATHNFDEGRYIIVYDGAMNEYVFKDRKMNVEKVPYSDIGERDR